MQALGERLAREQDELLARHPGPASFRGTSRPSFASLASMNERAQKNRRTRVIRIATASLVSGLAVAAAVLLVRARPLGLTVGGEADVSGHWISAPRESSVPLHFSDGTEMMLAPEAHARVLDVTRKGAHVMLESGKAQIHVTPNRGGQWTFTAGPFNVEVKGTRFAMAWSPREQLFTLTLVEGSVVISGCAVGEGRPLFAGETLKASCLANEFHIDRVSSSDAPDATNGSGGALAPAPSGMANAPPVDSSANGETKLPDAQDPASPEWPAESNDAPSPHASAPGRSAGASRESWQSLARSSHFKEAFARVNERGFDAELASAGRDDALLLGDVARLSGDSKRALVAYQRVRSRAPGTEAAANAAFSIGRVYFDQRESYGDAAKWFATYRRERRDGPLARDAMGRQMEALSRAGDRAAAARLADEYVLRYPQGPHAPLARSLGTEIK